MALCAVEMRKKHPIMRISVNRTLSIRKRDQAAAGRHRFSIATFRGLQQPELSKKMARLVKNENAAIGAHETAGRERVSIAAQLSDWGESTEDEAVSDISDKLGVLMAEMGEQEDIFAQSLEDYRSLLKQVRDTEGSVQPSRDQRAKIADEIQRLKWKEPTSPKLETLEHELVRAEAQNLVAEAQLTNVTRQKLKEAFDIHTAAVVERAEKQILLARHSRRLLNYLDDTPVVPGDTRQAYEYAGEAKQVLEDAESDLRSWERTVEPIQSSAGEPSAALLASSAGRAEATPPVAEPESFDTAYGSTKEAAEGAPLEAGYEEPKGKQLEQPAGQPVAVPY
ncbi:hypothetical protein ASPWEDRAFT_45968 [Aspergillus wentii DTO 134E9]|uniref:Sphingolipid long chain base-responsive protein LSP1 n=1 Tax=Aspergillus wentii DTO 134E9 TaxID=1073089 RepID=A0A1L9R688_ASPWE|nr:uncharacterized protein ASPWEDRAFT_45968 [Aspergillus wentii DTO 134E9]OJJ30393.1 hypothetical protein ASPWEDRAFT_45968 [Aspergillus wentii DTO 134E9]